MHCKDGLERDESGEFVSFRDGYQNQYGAGPGDETVVINIIAL